MEKGQSYCEDYSKHNHNPDECITCLRLEYECIESKRKMLAKKRNKVNAKMRRILRQEGISE